MSILKEYMRFNEFKITEIITRVSEKVLFFICKILGKFIQMGGVKIDTRKLRFIANKLIELKCDGCNHMRIISKDKDVSVEEVKAEFERLNDPEQRLLLGKKVVKLDALNILWGELNGLECIRN